MLVFLKKWKQPLQFTFQWLPPFWLYKSIGMLW
jgi:hypothetical protein